METKAEKDRLYYEANKDRILAQKAAQREARRSTRKPTALTPEETAEKYRQTRREWYARNAERVIAHNKAYREANKEKMKVKWAEDNKKKRDKKKEEDAISLKKIADKYAPKRTKAIDKIFITRTEIAKDLDVKLSYIDSISRKERYRMPRHKDTNGVVYLYDRKEIEEWYIFAKEVLAFHKLGERLPNIRSMYKFKQGSMAHGLITFMQNNKELHLRNLELRRTGEMYGRS